MSQTRTSVITVNYKGADNTAACIASLQQSTVPVSIVVVDNTPDDPELKGALTPYPDVKLIRAPKNLGFGRGNNLGIDWVLENTNCEFVFILNNDAMVEPDTIAKLVKAMGKHPDAAITTSRIVLAEDPGKLWYGGGEVDWKRGGGCAPGVSGASDAPLAMQSRYVSFASGCAMMFRADVLRQVGGFDARYFMYEEDLEICLRVQKANYRLWYESAALIHHIGQGSLRRGQSKKFVAAWSPENPNLPFYAYHILRNRLLTMKQYAHGQNRTEFLVCFPLFVLVKLFRFVIHRKWQGIGAMFEGWKSYRKEMHRN